MGLFDKIFDKRKRINYSSGCNVIFTGIATQRPFITYNGECSQISKDIFTDIVIGAVIAHLNQNPPKNKTTFGLDLLQTGANMLKPEFVEKHMANIKNFFFEYDTLMKTRSGVTAETIAEQICTDLELDENYYNIFKTDLCGMFEFVDSIYSGLKLV